MHLIDTCGWIEWLTNGELANHFSSFFAKPSELIVPTLIQCELYKWVSREKDVKTALEVIALTENGLVIPMDTNTALYAVDLAREFTLAMADAIIYATSQLNKTILITCDKHFKDLPQVNYIPK